MKIRDRNAAYVALGLEPGADRAAIEEAYRRLIKLHHPDRSGGDAARAAELNRAYFELRQPDDEPAPQAFAMRTGGHRPGPRRRRRSGLWPVVAVAVGALLLLNWQSIDQQGTRWIAALTELQSPGPATGQGGALRLDSSAIDGPLEEPAIAASIRDASRLARRGDRDGLAQHSRDCHRAMRLRPALEQLDRCAAFDDAVAILADRERLGDLRSFDASAVTARQMTAASLVSSDYLAIERRLDRIRTMVQLALRPRLPPLPPPPVEPLEAPDDPALAGIAPNAV